MNVQGPGDKTKRAPQSNQGAERGEAAVDGGRGQGAGDQGGAVSEERRVGVTGSAGKQGGDGGGRRCLLAERLEVHDVLAVGLEREGATARKKMAEESGG